MDRYSNVQVLVLESGRKYRSSVLYPDSVPTESDYYIISTEGDRYDKLAWEFYRNTSYWWIIASANPEIPADSLTIPPGLQMRVPAHPEQYIVDYKDLNS